MIKAFSLSSLIIIVAAVLESSILANISVLPVVPDLVLICVIYFSIRNGKLFGETTGFVSGLVLDLISACPFGLNCLLRTIIGYSGGIFNKILNTQGIFTPALIGFSATIVKGIVIWLINILYPAAVMTYNPISLMFLFELIANTILSPVIFKLLSLFENIIILAPEKID